MARPLFATRTPEDNQDAIDEESLLNKNFAALLASAAQGAEKKNVYGGIIDQASQKFDVPYKLIKSIVKQESGGNADAKSPVGAIGLMQLMPATAKDMGVTDPTDPEQNIMGGTKYFRGLMDRFGGDIPKALAGYNAGPGAVLKYGGVPPYKETQGYVRNIMANYAGGDQSPESSRPTATSSFAPTAASAPQNPNGITPDEMQSLGLDEKSQRRAKIAHLIEQLGSGVAGVLTSFKTPEFAGKYSQQMDDREKAFEASNAKKLAGLADLIKAKKTRPDTPNSAKEYEYYVLDAKGRGEPVKSYNQWQIEKAQAGAQAPIAFERLNSDNANKSDQKQFEREKFEYTKKKDAADAVNAEIEKANKIKEGHILPATESAKLAEGKNIPSLLDKLGKTLETNKSVGGPIWGRIQGRNPWATDTQQVQSEINAVKQTVGRFLEGGVLRKEDEEKYDNIMPTLKDTPDVRTEKLQIVRGLVEQKYNEYLDSFEKSGYNVSKYKRLGQTKGPTQPQQLSPEYQEALEWTRQNPNDPRTPGILKKIGVQ